MIRPSIIKLKQVILGPARLQATWVFDTPLDSGIIDTICEDLKIDVFAQANLDHIDICQASCSRSQQLGTDYRQLNCHDGLLFFKKLLYVPNGSCLFQIVQNFHDTYTTGHFGSTISLDLVQRSFKLVASYVKICRRLCSHMRYMLQSDDA